MFADDTNLFISDENIGELFQQINEEPLKQISSLLILIKQNGQFFIPLLKSVSWLKNFQNYSLMA